MVSRRILKHAILGLVSREDMSGYDITSEFKKALDSFGVQSTARSMLN